MPKPPRPDAEYFGKIDLGKLKSIAEKKREKLARDERERLKKLHWRRCAECGMEMESIPFKGVMIHKCFSCNGVFLESGTFEKLCGEELHLIESLIDLFKF
ncbi:MAG TPA: zf-TFIIB domain-containing protein [bacterium]|nr:zf-TFIIB domain-containing protein [bacterium]